MKKSVSRFLLCAMVALSCISIARADSSARGSRFGIAAIIGELMVGIVAGPGAFDLLHRGPFHGGEASNAFMLMAQLGGLVLMFIAGVETDIEGMAEAGGTAFLVALSGVIWPFVLGAGAARI